MNSLEKKRKEVKNRISSFASLQKYRNLDFPMNTLFICKNNLFILTEYFNETMKKPGYQLTLDTIFETYVVNYLNSVKGYINRKVTSIDKGPKCDYKDGMTSIIRKYWHTSHKNITYIDKVIDLRNRFEHEQIDNMTLKKTYSENGIDYQLIHEDTDLLELFMNCYSELERMSKEIECFINEKIRECNLRDCVLFQQAFDRKFSIKNDDVLFPEPTKEENENYDRIIDELAKEPPHS